jgi:hypothetical protein
MKSIHDLEVDDAVSDRMDQLFASIEAVDHASRIIQLAEAPTLKDYPTED